MPSDRREPSRKDLDENTRPFDIRRENDADERSNDDLHQLYQITLRDLDEERNRRWRAEQQIDQLKEHLHQSQEKSSSPPPLPSLSHRPSI